MTTRDLPPDAARDDTHRARLTTRGAETHTTRVRAFCFATFRFAQAPRFELVYMTASLTPRRRRWLRFGTPGKVSAQLLGLDDGPVANRNIDTARSTPQAKSNKNLRGGLSIVPTPARTAAQRPQYHREMEPRYDTCGGVFADWPDPGGVEQPV